MWQNRCVDNPLAILVAGLDFQNGHFGNQKH